MIDGTHQKESALSLLSLERSLNIWAQSKRAIVQGQTSKPNSIPSLETPVTQASSLCQNEEQIAHSLQLQKRPYSFCDLHQKLSQSRNRDSESTLVK